jgi:hypothetical protein
MRSAAVLVFAFLQMACDVCDGPDVVERAALFDQSDADDLEGVVCILGDLEIGDRQSTDGVTLAIDMSPLKDLTIIEGDLDVAATIGFTFLDLPNVTFIGRRGIERDGDHVRGGLFVEGNLDLNSFDLDSLTDVGGCVEFRNNPNLDPSDVDDLFADIKAHAFPGSCDENSGVEDQSDNGGAL